MPSNAVCDGEEMFTIVIIVKNVIAYYYYYYHCKCNFFSFILRIQSQVTSSTCHNSLAAQLACLALPLIASYLFSIEVLLQRFCCKDFAAKILLQRLFCNGFVAKAFLQRFCCIDFAAKAFLQRKSNVDQIMLHTIPVRAVNEKENKVPYK